ncbi:hypothetical protein PN836_004280 [Ningiella sp. W23]|uniref:hypothetical protein n=1 Tax=Ningiella sp. W23 TaxID=3023715 RepID=UPI0037566A90
MSKKLTVTLIVIVGLLSYGLGFITDKQLKTDELNANLIAQSNLVNDRWEEAMVLKHLYEQLLNSPETAKRQLRYALLLMYNDDVRLKGVFGDVYGTDNFAIKTNQVILDFLREHPLAECSNKNIDEAVRCNIAFLNTDA